MNKPVTIVCFGEVLWDVFPHGMKPGGAPLNVAYHLKRLGVNSRIISRVGHDGPGRELLKLMEDWGIQHDMCPQDEQYATSKVVAVMDEHYEVKYEILFPVAWDFIAWDDRFAEAVSAADALVFGSLAMRHEVSRHTLFRLLDTAAYRVFDVNLRHPFYSADRVLYGLEKTNLLKLNRHELDIICDWVSPGMRDEAENAALLRDHFQISEILVTRGGEGASYYTADGKFDTAACRVEVSDTVGSGDAFLAAFLSRKFKGSTIDMQLSAASVLGAFVAAKEGACPEYSEGDLQQFRNTHLS